MATMSNREAMQQMMQTMMSVSDVYRQFIPSQKGESLDEQIYPWNMDGLKEDMQSPIPIHQGDPNTITNIIQMMSVEMQHWFDYHEYSKWIADADLKKLLESLARAEHMHHLKLMSLLPAPHDASEMVLSGELSLLMAYNMCMANEPNDSVKQAFCIAFNDHLQHAKFAADRVQSLGCDVNAFTGGADLNGGRSINQQFMKLDDTMWQGRADGCYDKNNVDAQTLINVDMALAGETAAWDIYHSAIEHTDDQNVRLNYAAFQSIEDQHAGIFGSIKDPTETMLERSLVHEQVEIMNYQRLMDSEANPQVKDVFADLYREDLEHARLFGQMAR